MNVWGYCRVSCERQAEEGVSLEEQQRRLAGRAFEAGWVFAEIFVEQGVSGGIPLGDRPQGAKLLAAVQPGDIVVATKLDRMFRSALDALTVVKAFRERKISLWLLDLGGDVSGNGISQLMMMMLSAFAEFERYRIGERIRDAKRHQRSERRYMGGNVPYGWRRIGDGQVVEEPREQATIARMRALRAEGLSYASIGRELGLDRQLVRNLLERSA